MKQRGHALATVCLLGLAGGCATEDQVLFGEPENVVGSTGAGVTSGGNCVPDPACDFSFRDDVLPVLIEKAKCSAAGCHETAIGGFAFPESAGEARAALLGYTFQGVDRYLAPCEPDRSKLLCNLNLGAGVEGPFGACGSPMPKLLADATDDQPLSLADLDAVEGWVACGAPDN